MVPAEGGREPSPRFGESGYASICYRSIRAAASIKIRDGTVSARDRADRSGPGAEPAARMVLDFRAGRIEDRQRPGPCRSPARSSILDLT